MPRSCVCRISPNYHLSTTVLDILFEVFMLICCVLFCLAKTNKQTNMSMSIIARYLHFGLICPKDIDPEFLCFFFRCNLPILSHATMFFLVKRDFLLASLNIPLSLSYLTCELRPVGQCLWPTIVDAVYPHVYLNYPDQQSARTSALIAEVFC